MRIALININKPPTKHILFKHINSKVYFVAMASIAICTTYLTQTQQLLSNTIAKRTYLIIYILHTVIVHLHIDIVQVFKIIYFGLVDIVKLYGRMSRLYYPLYFALCWCFHQQLHLYLTKLVGTIFLTRRVAGRYNVEIQQQKKKTLQYDMKVIQTVMCRLQSCTYHTYMQLKYICERRVACFSLF